MKISNKIKMTAAGVSSVLATGLAAVPTFAVDKADPRQYIDKTSGKDVGKDDLWTTANTIINVVIGVIGFVTVIMIILGGVNYTTSAGDPAKVTKAKNTIMYGIIGLVISLLAFAVVNFVLGSVFNVGK